MTHYICTGGCNAVVDNPGVCQSTVCPKHGHPLEPCDCVDGKHHGAFDFKHDHEHSLPATEEKPNLPIENK